MLSQLLLTGLALCGQDTPPAVLAPGGLSGLPSMLTADILPMDECRITLEPTLILARQGGHAAGVAAKGCWGAGDELELGAEVPVYFLDEAWDSDNPLGDITISGKYLYESVRGGTSLSLTGRLELPTGEVPRDRGAELGVGICTSTTYRLFRLSLSAEYALEGGRNPLRSKLQDFAGFDAGIGSYLSSDLLVFCSVGARTTGDLRLSAGGVYLLSGIFSIQGTASAGLDESGGQRISLGACALVSEL
jgi:hypothetical protein